MASNEYHSAQDSSGLIAASHSDIETYRDDPKYYVAQQNPIQPDHRPLKGYWRDALIPMLIAALIAALITGAAVGGGVGSSLASCENDLRQASSNTCAPVVTNPSLTTSSVPTTTAGLLADYIPVSTGSVATLYNNCSALAQSPQFTSFNDKFSVYCGIDIGAGEDSVQKDSKGNALVLTDIAPIIAYTPQDCMQACSSFTRKATKWGRTEICRSIQFSYNMQRSIASNGANCWLKNGTIDAPSQRPACDNCLSAMLA